MADLKEKLLESVLQLVQKTQSNELQWTSGKPPSSIINDDRHITETVFITNYLNRKFRIYRQRRFVEPDQWSVLTFVKGRWVSDSILEILDGNGNKVWEFPPLSPTDDLRTAVEFQVAGVDDIIESLLGEGQEKLPEEKKTLPEGLMKALKPRDKSK